MAHPRRVPEIDNNIPPLTTGYHRNGVKVFIGGLPDSVREDGQLVEFVKRKVPHLDPFDPKVFKGGSTRGGCFIRVHTHEDADDLSRAFDGQNIGGSRMCKCTIAPKKDDELPQKLFIGNIKGITGGQIRAIFERFGEVIDLNMIKSGGAIIEMACSCDAMAALDALHGKYKPDENGPPIKIQRSTAGDKEVTRPIIPGEGRGGRPSLDHLAFPSSSPLPPRATPVHPLPPPPPPPPPRSYEPPASLPPAQVIYDAGSRLEESYMDRAAPSSYLDATPHDIYASSAAPGVSYLDRDRERGVSYHDRDRDRRRRSPSPPRYERRGVDSRPVPPAAPPPRFNEPAHPINSPATAPIPIAVPTPTPVPSGFPPQGGAVFRPSMPSIPAYELHAAAVGLDLHPTMTTTAPPLEPTAPIPYCPPAEYLRNDHRGPHGANLFVKGFPEAWGDFDLRAYFKEYGQLVSVKVYEDRETKESKDFGFVSFATAGQAAAALRGMNGRTVQGRVLKVLVKS